MASLDVGIDLGTSTIIASDPKGRIIVREPSVIAYNTKTRRIISIGADVHEMVGRTPAYIQVVRPLADGVISNFEMTGEMIKYLLKKVCTNRLIKPQVIVCVPSAITGVESQAVIDSTIEAGARRVYLIEEPVAAAIGAGIDLSKPEGNLIVDIGGGTSDIAVLSLNGIVQKTSIRMAGQKFDQEIVRYMRSEHSLLIGEKSAERIKIEIASVDKNAPEASTLVKGRDLLSGLPKKITITRGDLYPVMIEPAMSIVRAVHSVLEKTPPELAGDIRTNGIILTGGGSMLHGLDTLIAQYSKAPARLAHNPVECVAIGTAKSFALLGTLFDGFVDPGQIHRNR